MEEWIIPQQDLYFFVLVSFNLCNGFHRLFRFPGSIFCPFLLSGPRLPDRILCELTMDLIWAEVLSLVSIIPTQKLLDILLPFLYIRLILKQVLIIHS